MSQVNASRKRIKCLLTTNYWITTTFICRLALLVNYRISWLSWRRYWRRACFWESRLANSLTLVRAFLSITNRWNRQSATCSEILNQKVTSTRNSGILLRGKCIWLLVHTSQTGTKPANHIWILRMISHPVNMDEFQIMNHLGVFFCLKNMSIPIGCKHNS